ncbi:MAG: DUF5818 domain-containing protein [Terracidiphilus sp.]
MKSTQTQMLLGLSSCALLLASVQTWGATTPNSATPMPVIQEPQTPPSQTPSDQAMPNPDSSKTATFTGTVVKDGEQYVLRDSSGSVYKLDDASRAQAFEGKTVKVTGRLDADSKMIHVDSIQALAS